MLKPIANLRIKVIGGAGNQPLVDFATMVFVGSRHIDEQGSIFNSHFSELPTVELTLDVDDNLVALENFRVMMDSPLDPRRDRRPYIILDSGVAPLYNRYFGVDLCFDNQKNIWAFEYPQALPCFHS